MQGRSGAPQGRKSAGQPSGKQQQQQKFTALTDSEGEDGDDGGSALLGGLAFTHKKQPKHAASLFGGDSQRVMHDTDPDMGFGMLLDSFTQPSQQPGTQKDPLGVKGLQAAASSKPGLNKAKVGRMVPMLTA